MHEMSIVQALIEQVDAEVEQSAYHGRVVGVDLRIGRISGVHVDSLRFAFEILSPGTIVAQAQLRIEEPLPLLICESCHARSEIEQIEVTCPVCHSSQVTLQGGNELLLQSIELAEDCEGEQEQSSSRA